MTDEALRWVSFSSAVFREATDDVKINGIGFLLLCVVWVLHHFYCTQRERERERANSLNFQFQVMLYPRAGKCKFG